MRIIILYMIAVIIAILTTSPITATPATSFCPDTIIVIDPLPEIPPSTGPRSPALVPISASYEPLLSSVLLTFTSNLGEIEVKVMNTTTGGSFSDFVDTQFLYATIPITMGQGHYILLFTLPSGRQYKGEFDV